MLGYMYVHMRVHVRVHVRAHMRQATPAAAADDDEGIWGKAEAATKDPVIKAEPKVVKVKSEVRKAVTHLFYSS